MALCIQTRLPISGKLTHIRPAAGDQLQEPNNRLNVLAVLPMIGGEDTYDLIVASVHTFYVIAFYMIAGTDRMLVHHTNTQIGCGPNGEPIYDFHQSFKTSDPSEIVNCGVAMADLTADRHTRVGVDDIKLWFRFMPREGWLPYDTEGLWATPLGNGLARVRNVPFLQDGVAQGDVVRFETDAEGLHWSRERVEASGNCVVRVLPIPSGEIGRSAEAVHARFSGFRLGAETFSDELPLVAFDIPAEADMGPIKKMLEHGLEMGWWHFEVGCMSERWENS